MKRLVTIPLIIVIAMVLMACGITFNFTDPTPTVSVPTTAIVEPTQVILPPSPPAEQSITVYFMDENRFVAGTEPYEVAVTRLVPAVADLPRAVLDEYFKGPTSAEQAQGLRPHNSGFTHVRELEIEDGVAHVRLGGACSNNGAAYSVANLIMKNLSQFPQISYIKIYDENDSNLDPDSLSSSLPYCLEP